MRDVSLTAALRQPRPLRGSWCTFASFACVEAMTSLGDDFLVLDLQHTELTLAHFPAILGAFPAQGPYAVVRAPSNEYHAINWLLDQGVDGVLVPMVNSAGDARRAVDAAKFPPVGKRSFGPYRAARYGHGVAAYMSSADEAASLIVQVEDAAAARAIDSILEVPGVDAIFMGPNDLAFSLLKPGESYPPSSEWAAFARTPEVAQLCEFVLRRCLERGMPFGTTTGSWEEANHWLDRGASFVTYGSDFEWLRAGAASRRG